MTKSYVVDEWLVDSGQWTEEQSLTTDHSPLSTLIIGYGNPLRGDDGVGWAVVESYQSQPSRAPFSVRYLQFITVHQLVPELADPVSVVDLVIFVDASVEGVAGDVRVTAVTPQPTPPSLTHHVGPAELLKYAELVNGRCPPAYLITITGQFFGFEEKLSPIVAQAIPQVQQRIAELVQKEKKSSFF